MKTQLPTLLRSLFHRGSVQLTAILVLASLLISSLAVAQSGPGYAIPWWTIDNGAVDTSSGGGYTLAGTIGQVDAGTASGSSYSLRGGFWSITQISYSLNLPLVER